MKLATALSSNCALKTLDLRWNDIGPAGAEAILTMFMSNTTIVKIQLDGNKVSRETTYAIGKQLKSTSALLSLFQRLFISCLQLQIAPHARMPKIRSLSGSSRLARASWLRSWRRLRGEAKLGLTRRLRRRRSVATELHRNLKMGGGGGGCGAKADREAATTWVG